MQHKRFWNTGAFWQAVVVVMRLLVWNLCPAYGSQDNTALLMLCQCVVAKSNWCYRCRELRSLAVIHAAASSNGRQISQAPVLLSLARLQGDDSDKSEWEPTYLVDPIIAHCSVATFTFCQRPAWRASIVGRWWEWTLAASCGEPASSGKCVMNLMISKWLPNVCIKR